MNEINKDVCKSIGKQDCTPPMLNGNAIKFIHFKYNQLYFLYYSKLQYGCRVKNSDYKKNNP